MPPGRDGKANKDKRVLANRYQVEKRLGSGNFGTAFLVKDLRSNGEQKVLKEIVVGDLQPDETVDAMHEARLLSKLDNPGIVRFYDSFLDGECFCIITEYCEGGDLDQKISSFKTQGKRFTEQQIVEWTVELLLAVQHMHSRRVLHRDLKTRNIFLKNNRIKIGDFGISRILMGTVDMASTFTGTPYYMSPEVLKHDGYNSKSDIWSIGCILYELGTLIHAFEGQSLMGVMYKIVEGDCPDLPDHYSADLNAFLKKLLKKDPEERFSAGDALKVPFIEKHMEKMHDLLVDKRNQKPDSTIIATKEALEIAQELKKKSHLRDLQAEEETKYKNMTPHERMQHRKMEKADKKAEAYKAIAAENFRANMTRQQTVIDTKFKGQMKSQGITLATQTANALTKPVCKPTKSSNVPSVHRMDHSPPSLDEHWADDNGGTILQPLSVSHVASVSGSHGYQTQQQSRDLSHRAAAPKPFNQWDADEDGTLLLTTRSKTVRSRDDSGIQSRDVSRNQMTFPAATGYGDRPITPMKNTIVYSRDFSAHNFEDGIPDEAAVAETFYSQYDDFEEVGGDDVSPRSDDEGDLITNMERVLAQADGMRTLTINDEKTIAAFGPAAREEKIKNMRLKCIQSLGVDLFHQVYAHIRDFRSKNCNTNVDETEMMRGVRHLVKQSSDAFLVDQLVFMEMGF